MSNPDDNTSQLRADNPAGKPANIILDIGNVICHWDPDALSASVFEHETDRAAALSVTVGHADWLELDRGTLKLDDAVARAQARSDLNPADIAEIYTRLPQSLREVKPTTAAMRRAHAAGVPLYILSNMHQHSWEYLEATYDCFQLCAGVVVSCAAGFIKPDQSIYQHLCETFLLAADSCVFIDDMPENIQAARVFGMHGHVLANPDDGGALIDRLVADITGT